MILSKLLDRAQMSYSLNAMRIAYPKHMITIITRDKLVAWNNLKKLERSGSHVQAVKHLPNGKYVAAHMKSSNNCKDCPEDMCLGPNGCSYKDN